MPSYTTLTQSGRTRLLRTTSQRGQAATSTVVTTFPEGASSAAEVATALTAALTDIPTLYAGYVLEQTGADSLRREAGWPEDWEDLPAPTAPFSLRRRVLNALDGDHDVPNGLWPIRALRHVLREQPASVRRAARDEVAAAFAAYDSVPVMLRVYDYKWDECDAVVLANAALEAMTSDELGSVRRDDALRVVQALDELGLADLEFANSTWEAGYLAAAVNWEQFTAWRAARTGPLDR